MSRLMRDELLPGKEVAAYWIEHVLRHGGTKHLQLSGKDMPFYQRYLLDVLLFLGIISMLILVSLFCAIRYIISKCFPSRNEKVKSS